MEYVYKGTKVFYKIIGDGGCQVVFLHGWGGSSDSFSFICPHLDFNYKALFIDFPPFGESGEPIEPFTIFDYSNIVEDIMTQNGFIKPLIVAHSFGGRVAIILGSRGIAGKLVLTASAGLKPRRGLLYHIKVCKYKFLKKIGIKTDAGSSDYRQLSPIMKKTFVNIVSTNLEKYAIHINVPTILFWGKKDKDTPFYMAKRLKKLIPDCEIIASSKLGHFCYIENYLQFVAVINSFINTPKL